MQAHSTRFISIEKATITHNLTRNGGNRAPPGVEPVAQFVSMWEDISGRLKRLLFASYDISIMIVTCLIDFDNLNRIWLNLEQMLLQRAPPRVEPVAQFVSIWEDISGPSKRLRFASYDISMMIGTCLIHCDHLNRI